MYGWICPRCGTVWGPNTFTCTCQPPSITTTGTSSNSFIVKNDITKPICELCKSFPCACFKCGVCRSFPCVCLAEGT